jgi:hypothetical protein
MSGGELEKTVDRRDIHQFPFIEKLRNIPSVPGLSTSTADAKSAGLHGSSWRHAREGRMR